MVPVPESVCAVVRSSTPAALAVLVAQSRQPDAAVAQGGSWRAAIAAGAGQGTDWLWLLEADVEPEPDALARLVAPLEDLGDLPAPALLAGKVLGPDGRLHADSAPWIPLLDRVGVVAAARRRLVALRLARWGSLLVRRSALAHHGLPREEFAGGADDLEWTARVLRDDAGYLVPRSVAVRTTPAHGPSLSPAEVRDRVRMVRGDGWVGHEPVWFAFMLGVDALRDLRAAPHPRTAARLARGVSAGLAARGRG